MLDVKWIRDNRSVLEEMLKNRRSKLDVSPIYELDTERRALLSELEKLQAARNKAASEIGRLKAQKQDATALIQEMEASKGRTKELETKVAELEPKLQDLLLRINNVPDASVPVGASAADNKELRQVGQVRDLGFPAKSHLDIGEALGILDFKAGAKLSGSGFPVLRGQGARLERALINFFLDVHTKEHGYTEVFAPYLVTPQSMQGTGQLPKFEEDLFRLERDNAYLIPTAEVSVTNLHRDEVFEEKDLPRKYVCYSACFRREAGSYGADTKGLIRNHQFNKVELVQFVKPEDSLETLELLTASAEKILYKLQIPYRVIALCTGDIGFASAKTYDLEVWMPGELAEESDAETRRHDDAAAAGDSSPRPRVSPSPRRVGRWREISSCSTFTDFQARRMNIKFKRADGKKEFVHTLNGSGVAVGRTMAAILENFQQADGSVIIPEVLRPYTGFDRLTPQGQ
jgi:seryl-tRNA synthetase